MNEDCLKRERDISAAWARSADEAKLFKAALEKIENLEHDGQCVSDQGSRDGDCMDDHRCYCAQRIARDAKVKQEELEALLRTARDGELRV
jgi:hypothetical protein